MNRLTIFLVVSLPSASSCSSSTTTAAASSASRTTISAASSTSLPIALMLAAGIWASRRTVGETLRQLMIWLVIILVLVTGYLYRHDAARVGNRLLAGLIPGRAVVVTTSEGGQEVILHKLLNGHFEADVAVNGQTIQMLVDTGASMVALSHEDAEALGIDPASLTYSHDRHDRQRPRPAQRPSRSPKSRSARSSATTSRRGRRGRQARPEPARHELPGNAGFAADADGRTEDARLGETQGKAIASTVY